MQRTVAVILMICVALGGAGCATPGSEDRTLGGEQIMRVGTVENVQAASLEGEHQLGIGAILGAAVGFGVGSLIGRGSGQDVARVLGTLGGAYAGSTTQSQYGDRRSGQYVTVRLDNGVLVQVTQPGAELRNGDRVEIIGTGAGARVQRR